jgi:hypothetical protein
MHRVALNGIQYVSALVVVDQGKNLEIKPANDTCLSLQEGTIPETKLYHTA